MTLRSTIPMVAMILFSAFFSIVGARAQASLAVPGVIIERPPAVQNLIARLKTARPFANLEDKPTSCWEVPNTRLTGCRYLPGDLWITVVWSRLTLQPQEVLIRKSEPLVAPPFAWADLAASFHRLCPELTAAQADAMAGEAIDKLLRERLLKCDSPTSCVAMSRETAEASRSFLVRGKCDLQLSETTRDGAIGSTLRVRIPDNVTPRLVPGR